MKAFNTEKNLIEIQNYNEYTTCLFSKDLNKLSTVKNSLPVSENNYIGVFFINTKVESFLYITIIGNGGAGASSGLASNPKNPNSLFGGAGGGGGGGAIQNLRIPLSPNIVYTFYILLADPGLGGTVQKPSSLNYSEVNGSNGNISINNNQIYCSLLSPTVFVAANGSPGLAYNSAGRSNGTGVGGMGGSGGFVKTYPYTYPQNFESGGSGGNGGYGYDSNIKSGSPGNSGSNGGSNSGSIATPNPYFSSEKISRNDPFFSTLTDTNINIINNQFKGSYGFGISGGGGGGGSSNNVRTDGGNRDYSGKGGALLNEWKTNDPLWKSLEVEGGTINKPTSGYCPGSGGGGGSGQSFNPNLGYSGCSGANGLQGCIIISIETNDLQEVPQSYIDNAFSKNNYYNNPNPTIPVNPTPVNPTPVNPTPVNPTPVNPTPVQTNISKPFIPPPKTSPPEEGIKCIIL
uniref:Uncharacterized protein n=1 Tax=viral metagenome TaxID=1070528 RepID=A0A6C0AF86_9ZZZZ